MSFSQKANIHFSLVNNDNERLIVVQNIIPEDRDASHGALVHFHIVEKASLIRFVHHTYVT